MGNAFEWDKGGFLDKVDGDVVDAIFEIASGEYADKVMTGGGNAKPPVVLKLTVESPDLEKPASQHFSVGNQDLWEIKDNGKKIVNVKGKTFREGSRVVALVEAMITAAGNGDREKGVEILIKRGQPTEARFYEGLSWYWESKVLTLIDGTPAKSGTPLPVRFLGENKAAAPKAGATSSKPAALDPAVAEELDALLVANVIGKTVAEVKTWAIHEAAIKAVPAYMKEVMSGKRLKDLEEAGLLTLDPETKKYI